MRFPARSSRGFLAARDHLAQAARGFLMGSADVVPGVSGGTVALVLGIYERLVTNIRAGAAVLGAAVQGRFSEAWRRFRAVEWDFILPLLAGIGTALVVLAALLEGLLEDHPIGTAAVFFGLVAGSIPVAWAAVGRWDPARAVIFAATAAATFGLLGLRSEEVADPALVAFFLAGAVAVVAMILPGISGSFILLMLGMYEGVLAAVNDRDVAIIGAVLVGAVVGLASFATLLDRLLRGHHDTVMAALVGLMAGSLRVLWPWPDGTDTARLAAPDGAGAVGALLLALAGFAAVQAIVALGRAREHPPPADPVNQPKPASARPEPR